ncbi:MAG TPA: histidine kinase N-terminal 7TM domain-containing protein [Gemmataceae bacterium]|nr:histidine kinase N-terminal 7TM domain-containing protein [Gemmataceae bacterium]
MTLSDWQSTPFIFPLLLSGLLCGWMAYFGWRRRAVPGAAPLALLMATLACWALVNLVEKSLVRYEPRHALAAIDYLFVVTVPGTWLVFAARFARLDRWLTRRWISLLFIEPVLILALTFSSAYHGLIYAATWMDTDGPYAIMTIRYGPFFFVNAAYTYLLFAAGAALLLAAVARQPGRSMGRFALVLGAMLVPVLGNVAYVFQLQPRRLTDLTPVYFTVPGLAAAWLLFRVRVFDILPIARDFVLDCLGDAVFVLDMRLRILDANLAARSLVPAGRPLLKEPLAKVLPELAKYLPERPGSGEKVTEIQLGSAGAERSWDIHVLPVVDHGATIGTLVRLTDVTERKHLQEELRHHAERLMEADHRKDEFLAVLAHELRNPLAPIVSSLQILKNAGVSERLAEPARQTIERQVQQLVRLVDDLLDVSRITRGKIQLRKEPVELATVVAWALETSRSLLDMRKHELTVALPPEPVWLEADLVRLAQVFSNLLNNAAKYTEEGGHISLVAERRDKEVVVRLRDTGVGMTKEMLTQAFDLFAQADRSLKQSQGGLGIGLTLVRTLVQLHGGSIQAVSEGPGKGTEFIARLPLIQPPKATRLAPKKENASAAARRILVVDDNIDAADSLARYLEMSGHQVRTANGGLEALETARLYRPEVVLLDIAMPGMDGYELARRLRQEHGLEKTLLVALTGYGQEEDRRRSREVTIDHHLVKPVDPETLQDLLAPSAAPLSQANSVH